MTISRRMASVFYALTALLALIGTWGNNLIYLSHGEGGLRQFLPQTLVNPASRSISVDVFCMFLAVSFWMCIEARRIGMKRAWLYVVLGALIAISVTFPLFMINRERVMAQAKGIAPAGTLSGAVVCLVAITAVAACAYTFVALLR